MRAGRDPGVRTGAVYARPMDLLEVLRTTGAVRQFRPDPIPDDVVHRILDVARFAPSGGNRQAWRVVVIQDRATRRALRDLYLPPWYEYLAIREAGLVPWAPVTDLAAEAEASGRAGEVAARGGDTSGGFAEHFDEVPVLLAVFADLGALAAVDRGFDRYTFAGGASIYPFVWNILLAARAEDLAGVVTTMPVRAEEAVKELLGAPDHLALAAVVALGRPQRQPRRLTRQPVEAGKRLDRLDGAPFAP